MCTPAAELVQRLASELPDMLGPQYAVAPPYEAPATAARAKRVGCGMCPDIVVENRNTGKVTLLEVAGSLPDDELPLATHAIMCKMKKANSRLKPHILLVSVSRVPVFISDALENGGIRVIQTARGSDVVSQVADLIRSAGSGGSPSPTSHQNAALATVPVE